MTVDEGPRASVSGFRAPGTGLMVAGSLISALGAYLFQIVGGRALGAEGFAPISVLWTMFFILATVVLVPVEQHVTREAASGRKVLTFHGLLPAIVAVVLAAADRRRLRASHYGSGLSRRPSFPRRHCRSLRHLWGV